MTIRTPIRTSARVAAYNLLICCALAVAAILAGLLFGQVAALIALGAVACATPLGKVLWP